MGYGVFTRRTMSSSTMNRDTLKEEVFLNCNLHVACGAGGTWPHEDANGDSQRLKSTQRLGLDP